MQINLKYIVFTSLVVNLYYWLIVQRLRHISEHSTHEPRRRSSSVRSASLSSADRQARVMIPVRSIHTEPLSGTVAEREDEQKRALLEEDVFEKLKLYGNAGDDDVSVVSYVLSRRSSYTESLPPGLGNRVRTNSLTLFGARFGVEKNKSWYKTWENFDSFKT